MKTMATESSTLAEALDDLFNNSNQEWTGIHISQINHDNNISDTNSTTYEDSFNTDVSYTVATCLMTLVGTPGNLLVLCAVITDPSLQSLANVFICNLAVADLCVSAVLNPLVIAGMFTEGDVFQNNFLCHLFSSVCLISCTCSIWSVAAIGTNRYVSICHHAKYRYYFNKRTHP